MSKATTFIADCLDGRTTPDKIDEYVERWHDGVIGRELELRELLGMSKHEYARWLRDADALDDILAARRRGHQTGMA